MGDPVDDAIAQVDFVEANPLPRPGEPSLQEIVNMSVDERDAWWSALSSKEQDRWHRIGVSTLDRFNATLIRLLGFVAWSTIERGRR